MSTSPSHTGSLPLVYGALAPRHPKSPLHVLFVAELGRQKYQVTPLSLPKNIIREIILVQLLKFRKQGTVWKIRLQPPLEGGLGQPETAGIGRRQWALLRHEFTNRRYHIH